MSRTVVKVADLLRAWTKYDLAFLHDESRHKDHLGYLAADEIERLENRIIYLLGVLGYYACEGDCIKMKDGSCLLEESGQKICGKYALDTLNEALSLTDGGRTGGTHEYKLVPRVA